MLGKRIGEAPLLICHLISVAVCNQMLNQLEELLQAPSAPNFYWALTNLPRPLIDMRKALEGERLWLATYLPQLPALEAALEAKEITPLSADQEKALMVSLMNVIGVGVLDEPPNVDNERRRLLLTAWCIKAYPEAKKALMAQGHSAKEVEALPVIQVVALQSVKVFLHLQDDLCKWFSLPYAERQEGLEAWQQEMRAAKLRMDVVPIFLALPAMIKVSFNQARLERRIAALRCVEAVRMYAAAHEGRPPASLGLVKDVPVPLDPVTGRAFEYKAAGNKATLYGPPPGKELPHAGNVAFYELILGR
jgi:hypothetical protein